MRWSHQDSEDGFCAAFIANTDRFAGTGESSNPLRAGNVPHDPVLLLLVKTGDGSFEDGSNVALSIPDHLYQPCEWMAGIIPFCRRQSSPLIP